MISGDFLVFWHLSEQFLEPGEEVGTSLNDFCQTPKLVSEHFFRPSQLTSPPIFGGPPEVASKRVTDDANREMLPLAALEQL